MPRQKRGSVAVYSSQDANDIILRVDRDEKRKMLSLGEGKMICRQCGRSEELARKFCGPHGQLHDFVLTVTPLFRRHRRSKPSVTVHDCRANVGEVREGEQKTIRAAQEKVQAWPFEHDHRAVIVVPREAFA